MADSERNYKQMSIFDFLKGDMSDVSSDDITALIEKLQIVQRERAKEERIRREEAERARRIEIERQLLKERAYRERQAREAAERHIIEVTSMELPMDWANFYATDEEVAGVCVESIPDGFVKCLNNKGCVDIEYIAAISGSECKEVIETLRGSIYQNPDKWGECFYKGWETAEEYLSGNVRKKLEIAKEANEDYHGYFALNVKALKSVIPPMVCAEDIYVTLGSPWVPETYIAEFVRHLIAVGSKKANVHFYFNPNISFSHDSETGTWECSDPKYTDWKMDQVYGTAARSTIDIVLRTLNMQSVEVTETVRSTVTKSGTKRVVNKTATLEVLEKQKQLIKEFRDWIWEDPKRKQDLEAIYDEKFGGIKQRHFDGGFLELPGKNPEIDLFEYQKNAVARILFSPNTLLSHDVGSGKTYIMIAAGMELRRMGLSRKNLYVVPNNIIGQWRRLFYELYPNADILCLEPKDFTPKDRKRALREIKNGDYDAIIMAYSSFGEIEISRKCRINVLKEEAERLDSIPEYKASKRLKRKREKLREELADLQANSKYNPFSFDAVYGYQVDNKDRDDDDITFEELGITRLFIDEAHNFKNVPIDTKIENVMGISATGSNKCKDMMDKVKIVQHDNGGGGVVFATGTPITNSITDAYIMQSYLQSGELALLELQSFDSWVGMFAEKNLGFEVDVDTSNYRMATRFSSFHNIPELTNIFANVADFHQMDAQAGIPEHDGYEDIVVRKTLEFQNYLECISERADAIRNGMVNRADDNMLLITTDGRKAALDMRLVNPESKFTTSSKVFECAQKVAEIYKATRESRSTQLVFCDTSTPKEGFNIYDELKGLLVKMGISENEIAYIHDATTERAREKLFESMRQGVIRVLIGSTFKLGLGVNVQTKLIALHHLDVPWRPSDMVQREGRILRQGNDNKKVKIYRYITEGSFDAYSWQLLETKQRFITDILSGCTDDRSGADVDDTVLDYAEVKALAVGNPLIKKRVEVANELTKYLILQKKLIDKHALYESELARLKERKKTISEILPKATADAEYLAEHRLEYTPENRRDIRTAIYSTLNTDEPLKEDHVVAFYNGFAVVVPKNASMLRPVVYLRNTGDHMVELTTNETLFMSKIDKVLDGLAERSKIMSDELEEIGSRVAFIDSELNSASDYAEQIQELKQQLGQIDEKLGVKKK